MIIEFNEKEYPIFDEIIEFLNSHSDFSFVHLFDETVLTFPGLDIYPTRRKVFCNNIEVKFTSKEYEILYMLASNLGRVLSYSQLYQNVWGSDGIGNEKNIICCHIHKIKGKIAAVLPNAQFHIKCIRSVGYCFDVESNKSSAD